MKRIFSDRISKYMTADQLIMACTDHYISAVEIWTDDEEKLLGLVKEDIPELKWKLDKAGIELVGIKRDCEGCETELPISRNYIDGILEKYNASMDLSEDNLLPSVKPMENISNSEADWHTHQSPVGKNNVHYSRNENGLEIELNGPGYGVGKWLVKIPVIGDRTYTFAAAAKCIGEPLHENDFYAIYTFYNEDGSQCIREHVEKVYFADDQYMFRGRVYAPAGCVSAELELWVKGYSGKVLWKQPVLYISEALPKRNARVAIGYISPRDGKPTYEENAAFLAEVIDRAGQITPDIIVLGEGIHECGLADGDLLKTSETTDGFMCSMVAEKARKYHTYILFNFHEKENGEYYNTSVLFDRLGKIVGKYRKTHLTVRELERGITPGTGPQVLDTDFGRVGLLICWDHYFSKTAEKMMKDCPEIVLVPTAGDAWTKCLARAMDTGIYYAVCGWNTENDLGWEPGRIVNPLGKILAQTNSSDVPAWCDIDLNEPQRRHWLSVGPGAGNVKGIYRYEKNPAF